MPERTPPKKWQNLIRKSCPKCGGKLAVIESRTMLYECRTPGCEFLINRRTLYTILTDESHIMHEHLTPEDRMELKNAVKVLEEEIN